MAKSIFQAQHEEQKKANKLAQAGLQLTLTLTLASAIACHAFRTDARKEQQEQEQMMLLALGAVAVSSSNTRPIQGSCSMGANACIDYHTGWTSTKMTSDCATVVGTLTIGGNGCSSTNRVASCYVQNIGAATASGTTATHRYNSPTTVATATTNCSALSGVLITP